MAGYWWWQIALYKSLFQMWGSFFLEGGGLSDKSWSYVCEYPSTRLQTFLLSPLTFDDPAPACIGIHQRESWLMWPRETRVWMCVSLKTDSFIGPKIIFHIEIDIFQATLDHRIPYVSSCIPYSLLFNFTRRRILLDSVRKQSIKKPNFWNREQASAHSTLALVALCSGDFKLYSDASSITPCQLVIELDALDWVCV